MVSALRNCVAFASLLSLSSIGAPQTRADGLHSPPSSGRTTGHANPEMNPLVTVRVYDYVRLRPGTLKEAEQETTRIFWLAGIGTTWLHCALNEEDLSRNPVCEGDFGKDSLVIRIIPESGARVIAGHPDQLGVAHQSARGSFGTDASIYYNRIEKLLQEKVVLGHVVAHEMGHLLLGAGHHSTTGLMVARWAAEHLNQMSEGRLLFTPKQATSMRSNLLKRAERSLAAGANSPLPLLTVNLYNHAQASEATLSVAKAEAARILRQAGIEATWPECPTEPELIPQYPDCVLPGPASLVLRIIPRSMARPEPTNPAAFGVALVPKNGAFGVFASVYIEAAAAIAGDDEALGARMLGHLMSHELGHLLLGEQSHSRRGIMRADWVEKDLRDAGQGRFLFTARQASQMGRLSSGGPNVCKPGFGGLGGKPQSGLTRLVLSCTNSR